MEKKASAQQIMLSKICRRRGEGLSMLSAWKTLNSHLARKPLDIGYSHSAELRYLVQIVMFPSKSQHDNGIRTRH